MKKLFLLGLTTILFFNCEKPKQRYFSASPEINSMKASITEYGNGDWDTWTTHFSDTAKVFANSRKASSITEFKKGQADLLSNFSSYGFVDKGSWMEMVIDSTEETWVNYWATWQGKLKANDQTINIPIHISSRFVDGKVVILESYYDSAPLNKALADIDAENALPTDEKEMIGKINVFVSEFLNKKDASVLDNLLANNYVKTQSDVKVASGSKELVESMNALFTGFPDFKITLLHKSPFWDNNIAVHWQLTGTNTGEFNGAPATGKKAKITGMTHLHFNNEGKVDMEDVYYDNLDLMQQLGHTLN